MRWKLASVAACLLASHLASPFSWGNPLLKPWPGPHGGVPPFDQVKITDFRPAFDAAMAERRAEIRQISENPAAPTFENTLVALEHSGDTLNRVSAVFNVWSGNIPTAEVEALEMEMSPILTALSNEFWQNEALYRRLVAIRAGAEFATLNSEQQRLVDHYLTQFALHGAKATGTAKARIAKINERLSVLETKFKQNVTADESEMFLVVDSVVDLAGLPPALIADAAEEAKRQQQSGKWLFANSRSTMEPLLSFATNRAVREKAFRMWAARGDNGNQANNNAVAVEILQLRQERSKLLGYPTFAHWRLADTMAAKPEAGMDLLMQIWKPAVQRVHEEVADMQRIVDAEGGGFKIEPWDYRYYAEKVRKAKYDLDMAALSPFLTIENVRKAMHHAAKKLYGLTLRPIAVPVFAEGVTAYEVVNREGTVIGLWYFDPFIRSRKRSGAWSTSFREQGRQNGKAVLPLAYDTLNLSATGTISWDDAETMFHEFGHALHTLNSNVTYTTLAGTNTAHDFVELPSHFSENYLMTAESLEFLVDSAGNKIPPALVERLKRAMTFNQGFATTEFVASAIVDMKLHLLPEPPTDMQKFEAETLREIGMPKEIIMRHRIPHFLHLFSSEQYAAGYYAYLWAQVLVADAFEAFLEAGNPFDAPTAARFHQYILSVGNSLPGAEAFRNFRGRDAKVDAMLRKKGFSCGEALTKAT